VGLLSPFYAATFDSTQFWELGQWYVGMDVITESTLHSHTGGTHTFVDMGMAAGIFEITAGVEAAQLAALDAKRGASGSLVWSRGTQTATLLDIIHTPGQAGEHDAYTVTLRLFSDDLPSGVVAGTAFITEGGDTFITEGGDTFIQE